MKILVSTPLIQFQKCQLTVEETQSANSLTLKIWYSTFPFPGCMKWSPHLWEVSTWWRAWRGSCWWRCGRGCRRPSWCSASAWRSRRELAAAGSRTSLCTRRCHWKRFVCAKIFSKENVMNDQLWWNILLLNVAQPYLSFVSIEWKVFTRSHQGCCSPWRRRICVQPSPPPSPSSSRILQSWDS